MIEHELIEAWLHEIFRRIEGTDHRIEVLNLEMEGGMGFALHPAAYAAQVAASMNIILWHHMPGHLTEFEDAPPGLSPRTELRQICVECRVRVDGPDCSRCGKTTLADIYV